MGKVRILKLTKGEKICSCPLPRNIQIKNSKRNTTDIILWTSIEKDLVPIFRTKIVRRLQKYNLSGNIFFQNYENGFKPSVYSSVRELSSLISNRQIHVLWPGIGDLEIEHQTEINRLVEYFKMSKHFLFFVKPYQRENEVEGSFPFLANLHFQNIHCSKLSFVMFENICLPESATIPYLRDVRDYYFNADGSLNHDGWRVACDRLISLIKEKIITMSLESI